MWRDYFQCVPRPPEGLAGPLTAFIGPADIDKMVVTVRAGSHG